MTDLSQQAQQYNHVVCKTKVKYHTLKSAERAKTALSVGYKTAFEVYRCGTSKHYHLTHKNVDERIGHGNKRSGLLPKQENQQ